MFSQHNIKIHVHGAVGCIDLAFEKFNNHDLKDFKFRMECYRNYNKSNFKAKYYRCYNKIEYSFKASERISSD